MNNKLLYILMIIMAFFLTLSSHVYAAAQYYASCEPKVGTVPIDGPLRNSFDSANKDANKMAKQKNIQACSVIKLGLGSS